MAKLAPRLGPLVALLLVGACAGAGGGTKTVTSRTVLTRDQIEQTHATNAFDAVQRLRSNWMRVRGSTQMPLQPGAPQVREDPVLVYLDDQKLGGVETLRTIEIAAVEYIRFYPPAEASARWGFNHGNGVIYVSTDPPRP